MNQPALIERIVDGLAHPPAGARGQVESRVKAAFLRWAVSLPRDADVRREAHNALAAVDRTAHSSPAVTLFKSYLETAAQPLPDPVRRGGRRARHAAGEMIH